MIRFIIRRLFFTLLSLFLLSVIIFLVSEASPVNVATNVLGDNVTNEQIAAFNAQYGLDQPVLTRYLRWLRGSHREAEALIGQPITRTFETNTRRYRWWIVDEDGTLFQNVNYDGETMIRLERQADGTLVEVSAAADVWQLDDRGRSIYWGIDRDNRAAMWVQGDASEKLLRTEVGWAAVAGAPQAFIPLKYGIWRGDPGNSFKNSVSIGVVLQRRLRNSLWLALLSFGLIMPVALSLGLIAGLYQSSRLDRFLSVTSLIAASTPEFVSGIFLGMIFSVWLGWLPGAVVLRDDASLFTKPEQLVLPILTLMFVQLGYLLRITRASLIDVLQENYIRTAILKGVSPARILFKHALKNALFAPITVMTLHITTFIGNVVIIEMIFGFPGVGRYMLESTISNDVFAMEAIALVLVIIASLSQFVADLLYVYLNPRIRYV